MKVIYWYCILLIVFLGLYTLENLILKRNSWMIIDGIIIIILLILLLYEGL